MDALDQYGYGRLQIGDKAVKAHRVAFEMFKGAIPEGRMVCHTCDVRACVNPEHLYAGTAADNVKDCVTRGRYVAGGKPLPGAANPKAKLTEAAAIALRKKYEDGASTRELAEESGLTIGAVWRLVTRRAWAHV